MRDLFRTTQFCDRKIDLISSLHKTDSLNIYEEDSFLLNVI